MLNPAKVGRRIRQARIAKGLNQTQLAVKASLSKSTLSDIERGKLDPKLSQAGSICHALGVDLNWLYGYSVDDLDTLIDSGELNIKSWQEFRALKLEFRKKVYDEVHFLFEQQQLVKRDK